MTEDNNVERVDLEEYILEYLRTHDTIKPSDIVDKVGQSKQTISNRLRAMGDQGLLEQAPSGKGYVIWQLPKKQQWRGVRLRDLDEHEGTLRIICRLAENYMQSRDIAYSLRIEERIVNINMSMLCELGVVERWPDDHYRYRLTEDGKRLVKAIQQLERV